LGRSVQRLVLLFTPSVSALVNDLHRALGTYSCIHEDVEGSHLISFNHSNFSGYYVTLTSTHKFCTLPTLLFACFVWFPKEYTAVVS